MNINELIEKIGGTSAVRVQYLDECMSDLRSVRRGNGGTKITFLTDKELADILPSGKHFGMVLWMDRAKVKHAQEDALKTPKKKKKSTPTPEAQLAASIASVLDKARIEFEDNGHSAKYRGMLCDAYEISICLNRIENGLTQEENTMTILELEDKVLPPEGLH